MSKRSNYLYQRQGSQNWYLRIQYPAWLAKIEGRKKLEISLKTPDLREAEVLALPYIHDHKAALLTYRYASRNKDNIKDGGRKYAEGKHYTLDDGRFAVAEGTKLRIYGADGREQPKEDNPALVELPMDFTPSERKIIIDHNRFYKKANADDRIIQTWFDHRNISDRIRSSTLNTWELFKKVTNDKPLDRCTRDDGRKLVKHLTELDLSTGSIRKRLFGLSASVNMAIDEGTLKFNPFLRIIPAKNDQLKIVALDETDMKIMRDSLDKISTEDQLLWKLLALTGMRLDEPFQIHRIDYDNTIPYFEIGTKTRASRRKLPIPTELIPYFMKFELTEIFRGRSEFAGRRLRRVMSNVGISYDSSKSTGNPSKVLHSLRHRAKDRLRSFGCPLDMQHEILGHRRNFSEMTYGSGYPMDKKLRWIDQIGY